MVTTSNWLAKFSHSLNMAKCCWLCQLPLFIYAEGGLCDSCRRQLPRLPPHCQRWRCRQPELAAGRYWFAAFAWHPSIQLLIHRFKFQHHPELASLLAPLLAAQVQACYQRYPQSPWPDLIVPMPLTRRRWRQRGYNQAGLLAKQIGQLLSIPVAYGGLRRLHERQAQHRSQAHQRWQNMRSSLRATRSFRELRVAVVDDVLTTGASISAAALALQQRGAIAIDAWTLAFTEPYPSSSD